MRAYVPQPDMETPPPRSEGESSDTRERPSWDRGGQGDSQRLLGPDSSNTVTPEPPASLSLQSLDQPQGKSSLYGLKLLEYEGLPLLDLYLKFSSEAGPAVSFDYVPSPSLGTGAKSLREALSFELSVPIAAPGVPPGLSVVVGRGMDGSGTVGLGWSPPVPESLGPLASRASVGGPQIYAYTVCPDTGPCFDAGMKFRAGAVTLKADAGVSTGPGFGAMATDFGRAIINGLGLPTTPTRTLPY